MTKVDKYIKNKEQKETIEKLEYLIAFFKDLNFKFNIIFK